MMKREKAQNKKWLWIVLALAALLAAVGVALALLLPGGGTQQEAPTGPATLYWNVDRLANLEEETGMSIRTKGEDGLFRIRFALDGQQVELPVTGDKRLVNYIDTMDVMGLIMDGDGIVVDAVEPKQIADETAKDFYVKKVDGDKLILNSSMAMNGMETEITLSADTGIYDVDPDAEVVGQPGTPQIMDKVSVYSEMGTQNVTHVFLTEHPEDAEVFWRVEKCWDSKTSKTTREPDENGVYTLQMAHEGELVELKCKDIEIVNAIDGQSDNEGQCALQLDEEGYIVGKVDFTTALRGKYLASQFWITAIEGDTYTATKLSGSDNGKTVSFTLPENCDIFQCCQDACYEHNCGERTDTLQLKDRVNVFADLDGNVKLIFISRRSVDSPMYYNFERQNGTGGTQRKADKNGYYKFELLADGKIVTVRAPSKAIADQMDAIYNGCMGLKLNGDMVERVYSGNCVSGYFNAGAYSIVQSISGAVVSLAASTSNYFWNKLLSPDCVVYNAITGEYGAKIGGTTTLQVGDTVNAYRDMYDQFSIFFVTSRYAEGAKVYYNLDRSYNSTKKETNRIPDENGYYVFEMACEGKTVTVKTKSKGMASFIDQQQAPLVALKVNKSGVVTNAYIVTSALKGQGKACNYRYVENVTKTTFNTFYYPAATPDVKTVDKDTYTLADESVVYNVSLTYSKYRGEKTTLKNGDYIQAIRDLKTNKITQIFVMQRDPTYGVSSYKANCSHCGKTVTWKPYNGKVAVADGHYFMCADIAHSTTSIGAKDDGKVFDIVLDLKGYKLTGTGRTFMIYDKLTVMDTKGGGKIVGTSTRGNGGSGIAGAAAMVYNGGQLDLMGGELTLSNKSTAYGNVGGVLYIGEKSVVNMSGGKITGGIASASGGNIISYGGTFNMTGGTVEGGTAPAGANMYFTRTKVNISGGNIDGGFYALNTCEVTLSGAPVISGTGLEITPGMKISVEKLSKGASIVISGDGMFTGVLTNPESYLAYFKAANEGDSITVEGSALCYYRKPVDYNGVDNSNLKFASGTTNAYCPVCDATVAWTALTAEKLTLSAGRHYYLAQDLTYKGQDSFLSAPGAGKVCVHLNGHNITATTQRVFQGSGATVNIMGNGTVTGGWTIPGSYILGGAVGINTNVAGGTFNLIGGTYMSTTTAPVVAISNNGGKINMYAGATIRGDSDTRSVYVGAAELINAEFNVYGGKIEGGSVYMIGANTAKGNATSMTISGGTITGGVEISGGSTLTLSGAPVISGTPLRIPAKVKVTLGELTQGASILVSADGVFTEANDKVADYAAYFNPADAIAVQDNALYFQKAQKDPSEINKNLEFAAGTTTALCPICEKEVSWTALTADAAVTLTGGSHYYLTGNLTFEGSDSFLTAPGTGSVSCLHLNGHNITATKNRVVQGSSGVVNIMGNGNVSGNFSKSGSWNIVAGATIGINTTGANGAINLYGGTYVKAAENTTHAAVAIAPNGGIINMYEGATIDGTGLTGANVSVCNGTFNMYGGKILGGTNQSVRIISGPTSKSGTFVMEGGEISGCSGSNVYVCGIEAAPASFVMFGGSVAGNVTVDANSDVGLTGAPVITMGSTTGLKLADGVKLYLGELTEGAEIVVSANGVFTHPSENVADYVGYFKPVAADDKIVAQDNVLSYTKAEQGGDDTEDDDDQTVDNAYTRDLVFDEGTTDAVCPVCGEKKTWTAITSNAALGASVTTGGHYYLSVDVVNTSSQNYIQVNGKNVCLHLNGHDLTYAGRIHVTNAASTSTLNIMGRGTVKSTATTVDYGTIMVNGGASVVNLYGGTYKYEGTAYAPIVVDQKTAVINMYEGAAVKGVGTVGVLANKGFFNMYGGTVTGGISAVTGTVSLGGAPTVDGITVAETGKLVVKADFTGTACATFAALTNNTIPEANGVSEGEYTGKLYLNELESQLIIGKDGKLVIEGSGDDNGDGDQTEENVYTKDLIFDEGTTDAVCPVCGEKKTWTAISSNNALKGNVTTGGHYYLAVDVVNTADTNYIQVIGKTVCLHLNGHDLTYAGRIHVTNAANTSTLNIMGNGTVKSTATAADYGAIMVNGGASVVNLYGGTYKYDGTAYAPIAIDAKTAAANMYEGATVEGTGTVGVLANKGFFNMYGGTVTGGISAVTGTVTLDGASTVDSITVAETGKLTVKADYTGTACATFAALTNNTIPEANGVSEGAYTGTLYLEKEGLKYIVGKDGKLVIENRFNNDLIFDEGTTNAVCPVCGEKKTWTAISNNDALKGNVTTGGHYYLASEVINTADANYMQVNGKNVCLHLNGHDLTYAGRIQVTNGTGKTSTLNIMGNGTVKSTATVADYGTIIVNGGASTVNLYGGTYKYDGTSYAPVVIDAKTATANMYEGAGVEGTGTVGVLANKGFFNMYGGTVTGGISAVTGTVNLGGASIVTGKDGALLGNIAIAAGGKLVVAADFTGVASVSFGAMSDNTIPEANGVSQSAYTGKLYLEIAGTPAIVGEDGKLVLAAS